MAGRGGSPLRVSALFAAYALVHSLLAARPAKAAAERLFGTRYRRGLYRFLFNAQAVLLFIWAVRAFLRLPDRTLYRVSPPWSWSLTALQAAGLGLMAWAAWTVGLGGMTGLRPLSALLTGRTPQPEPEAQGPPAGPDGEMALAGPFRFTRHPANWGPLPVVLCFPRMTVNRATVAALSVGYLVLGSVHEEWRHRAAYGEAYRRYQRRVPFLLGIVRSSGVGGRRSAGRGPG